MRQTIQYLGLTMLFVGFAAIGAAAGMRISAGVFTGFLECATQVPLTGPTPCQQAVKRLNNLMLILLVGGVVSMLSGGLGLWQLNHLEDD